MEILLCYSLNHFNPYSKNEQVNMGSSASILARTLFNILIKKGNVTYIDQSTLGTVKGKDFDIFIGIVGPFSKVINAINCKRSILFVVNMHPSERNELLLNFINNNNLNIKNSLQIGHDTKDTFDERLAIKKADFILGVGNMQTLNSYLKFGVDFNKIKMLNYGLLDSISHKSFTIKEFPKIRFVYVSSDIGLRKGFDIIYDIFSNKALKEKTFEIHVIGKSHNNFYSEKINKLKRLLDGKFFYHGWIDSSCTEYKKLIGGMDIILFPSIEEGQAGTVLDSISQGLIPVLSRNVGIDFSPLGNFDLELGNSNNYKIIGKIFEKSFDELKKLKNQAFEYYSEFHADFYDIFRENLDNIINKNELYPKFSIILPIFNKEKSIEMQLNYLELAINKYKNVEFHIIFDGCIDSSKRIVQNYFKDKEKVFNIHYYETPDIFEVRSNNLGLQNSSGKYCLIIQDDTFIYQKNFLFEIAYFLEKNPKAAILGCLAGVNFYPLGTKNLKGNGQIVLSDNEVYWRQDADTSFELTNKIFEVDACMRGPLVIRKSFLDEHGYLDEIYAPLYNDDMDICFRAKSKGFKVYCNLMNVENKALTMANYNSEKSNDFKFVYDRNTSIFYKRWNPSIKKNDYLQVNKIEVYNTNINKFMSLNLLYLELKYNLVTFPQKLTLKLKRVSYKVINNFKSIIQWQF